VLSLLSKVESQERTEWLELRCTQAMFLLLEASRMQAIEAIEEGPDPERLKQMAAQSQLASTLIDDLSTYITEPQAEDEDDEH